jgi:transposase
MQLALPFDTDILIPADDSVRLLNRVMEELDYTQLYAAYSRHGENPAVHPKNLFKVLVYGYMNNHYSSRALETACRRDINFLWLLQGQKGPDHNTIARFRSERLTGVVEDLFRQLVLKLHDLGQIRFENLFVDGTKIEACANKYSFVWKKATNKNESKLQSKAQALLSRVTGVDNIPVTVDTLRDAWKQVLERSETEGVQFVSGKGRHKNPLQREAEELEEYMNRLEKYTEYNRLFDGRNSFSKTDPDATFMHMKEDHMRNSQLKPGYNVQIGVEGEYIVGVDIRSERNDKGTLIPLLTRLESMYPKRFDNVVADAGYESEENYVFLDKQGYGCYIKPQNYEQSKKRNSRKNIGRVENMTYDAETDEYICVQGRRLQPTETRKRKSATGYVSTVQIYECVSCEGCVRKSQCTKRAGNKQMEVARRFVVGRECSLRNITSGKGILLRMNRSIQVEGTFGVLKEDHGFRRFLLRGKKNVRTEYLLLSFGYNLNKLHNKIQNRRTDQALHEKTIA